MFDRLNPEDLFLEHLGWIEKVAATVCAKHGTWGAEAEDFAGWIRMKLMEDGYAVFRKFRGESELKTYIATVVVRQFHEYGRGLRGRWRPSQAAERLGPPAPQLEALVYRDGHRLEQAGEILRTAGRTTLSDGELARLLARVPARGPMRPVEVPSEAVLDGIEDASRADERITAAEAGERRAGVLAALKRALARLDGEDAMIVRMHLADGRTLADVARALQLEQKPLYRRVDRLRRKMRELLAEEGVREGDVRAMLGDGEAP